LQEKLQAMAEKSKSEIESAATLEELKHIQVHYLGKKGEITAILRGMGQLSPEERPVVGSLANRLRDELAAAFAARESELKNEARQRLADNEQIDVTLPGRRVGLGHLHPLTLVLEDIAEIFLGLGFTIVEGPEIETDYYNF